MKPLSGGSGCTDGGSGRGSAGETCGLGWDPWKVKGKRAFCLLLDFGVGRGWCVDQVIEGGRMGGCDGHGDGAAVGGDVSVGGGRWDVSGGLRVAVTFVAISQILLIWVLEVRSREFAASKQDREQ